MTYVEVLIGGDTSWWHKNSAFQTLYLDPKNNLNWNIINQKKITMKAERNKVLDLTIPSPLLISLSYPSPFDPY